VVPNKNSYYVDEPVSINSVVTLQRRSSSGAIISEKILPFLPEQDPVKNFAILDIKWKIFSTYSPENSQPPVLNLDFLVDHCNNPP
jgi:hypothetical protein